MRINKYLQQAGLCSRRNADKLIADNRVLINGVPAGLGDDVGDGDSVTCNGAAVKIVKQKSLYIALNKPAGYISSSGDQFDRSIVLDLVKLDTRLFCVGRLDYQTEGLLFLTNDGDFAQRLTHPRNEIPKTYFVRVRGVVTDEIIEQLSKGVVIEGVATKPAHVERVGDGELYITIREGRNRQVRKMCEAVGVTCMYLKRTAIGPIALGNLPLGKYRELSKKEVAALMKAGLTAVDGGDKRAKNS